MSACSCCCCCCWQQVSSIQQERAGTEGLVAQLGKQAAALEAWLSNHEWKADAVAATTADGSNALDINKARLFAELIALLSAGLHVVCCSIQHRMPPLIAWLGYCRALTAVEAGYVQQAVCSGVGRTPACGGAGSSSLTGMLCKVTASHAARAGTGAVGIPALHMSWPCLGTQCSC